MVDEKQTHEDLGDDQEPVERSIDKPNQTILLSSALPARRAFVQYDVLTLLGLGLATLFTSFGILSSKSEISNFTPSFFGQGRSLPSSHYSFAVRFG